MMISKERWVLAVLLMVDYPLVTKSHTENLVRSKREDGGGGRGRGRKRPRRRPIPEEISSEENEDAGEDVDRELGFGDEG